MTDFSAVENDQNVEIVQNYDDGKFVMVRYKEKNARLADCGKLDIPPGDQISNKFYALRDENNEPHVILYIGHWPEYSKTPRLNCCMGQGNKLYAQEYFPYIRDVVSAQGEIDLGDQDVTGLIEDENGYTDPRALPEQFEYRYWFHVNKENGFKLPEYASVYGLALDGNLFEPKPSIDNIRTKKISYSWHNEANFLYRENGPAYIVFDTKTGKLIEERWSQQTEEDDDFGPTYRGHRIGGPAHFELDPATDIITLEEWAVGGKRHREGNASYTRRSKTGIILEEEWSVNGEWHRPLGGPAFFIRDEKTNIVLYEDWSVEGKSHRGDDLPAAIMRDKEGKTITQSWHENGFWHRECGPALTVKDNATDIVILEAYLQKNRLFKPENGFAITERNGKTGEIMRQMDDTKAWGFFVSPKTDDPLQRAKASLHGLTL